MTHVLVSICIYLPLTVCYGYTYYKQINHVALKERYASIGILEIFGSSMGILFGALRFININNAIYQLFVRLCYFITSCFVIICWIWRFWMISFSMNHSVSLGNQQWIYIINPNSIQLSKHKWYLQNVHKFGNSKLIGYYIAAPFLLCVSVPFVVMFFYAHNSRRYYTIAIFSVFLVMLLIIYFKIPKFKDEFFISDELKRIMVILCGFILTFIFITAFGSTLTEVSIMIDIIATLTISFFLFTTSLMSTCWVLRKLKFIDIIYEENDNEYSQTHQSDTPSIPLILQNRKCKFEALRSRELKKILNNYDSFAAYIDHLRKELSVKYLVAFVEIIQLQQYIWETNIVDIVEEKFEERMFQTVAFYDGIPKSLIVFSDVNDDDEILLSGIKRKSDRLFKKYIDWGSEYEVLLTKRTRNKICEIMSHIEWIEDDDFGINVVMELWDDVCEELFRLLLDGFSRFQCTNQYHSLDLTRSILVTGHQ
eukprot:445629_1